MDTYWLLSATANQGTFDEAEMVYSTEEGPTFMKEIADMTTNFGSGQDQEDQETQMWADKTGCRQSQILATVQLD